MEKLYIIDAVQYLFRSYFAIGRMTNKEGQSTGALFGFIRSVQKLIKDFHPIHVVAVFDGPDNKKSRTDIYKEYKSHREGMPDDLIPQLELAHDYCKAAGLPMLSKPGVEADDVIGCVAKWGEKKGAKVFVCSSDKDLCQLVNDHIVLLKTHKDNLVVDRKKVKDLYGVNPEQIVDYLAIVGDTSDNIPGVAGLGPKAASTLLSEYGDLQSIYDNIDDLKGKRKENLITYKKEAFLSQTLATLHLDLTIPEKESEYTLGLPDNAALTSLYEAMNYSTLLKEMTPTKAPTSKKGTYHLVNTETAFKRLLDKLKAAQSICIDTETTSLHPIDAELVGIGFGLTRGEAYYVPLNGALNPDDVLKALKPILTSTPLFGHNLKYDLHILESHGITIKTIAFDTMLASYLLAPHRSRHGLDYLAKEHFHITKTPIKKLIGTGKKEITMKEVPIETVSDYCCEDIDVTFQLKELFEPQIKERKLTKLFEEIELPLIPILADMERTGIYLDSDKLKQKSKELITRISHLEKEIYALANTEFNINSPKQLSEVLYQKLKIERPAKKRGSSVGTGAEILKALAHEHPIAGKVITYRQLEKLRSTYVDALPKQVSQTTGRIHCSFNQSVAATGRLSCTDPNLQNIPVRTAEGRKIREAFHPEKKGMSFLSADYSQIELRILAHLSEDPALLKAFNEKKDIHAYTASLVFDVPLDKVTKEMRHRAKAVNFGLIYGQSAFGLSQELDIEPGEARAFIKKYFERYPKVQAFLEKCKEEARKHHMVVTMTGRQRPLPDITSKNSLIRSASERLAINTPFQGAQADIIKMAMIAISKALKSHKSSAHMILQIHDELIFEVPDSEVSALTGIVKKIMEGIIPLKVPLTVDISVGKNWGEC